jgi:DNA-binding transcriptional ArsR family regulator
MMWALYQKPELCVKQVMQIAGTSRPNASNQLRLLAEHGLVISRREKMNVIYRAEANLAMPFAPPILTALRDAFEHSMGLHAVIRQATALSHSRRIEIIQALKGKRRSFENLQEMTGMSGAALARHLDKLIRRRFAEKRAQMYGYGKPTCLLGRTLIKVAANPSGLNSK